MAEGMHRVRAVVRRGEFRWLAVLAGAFVLLLMGLLTRTGDSGDPVPATTPLAEEGAESAPEPEITGPSPEPVAAELSLGSADASVTMVVFSDYQCSYCAEFATERLPELVGTYVEPGTLRVQWRDYPYKGQASTDAAVAARAAGEQGAYWEYHDALFEQAPDADLSRAALVATAGDIGLDTAEFEAALDDPRIADRVEADLEFGIGLGIPGTPAFLIDGEAFFGAQPLAEFEKAIEAAARS